MDTALNVTMICIFIALALILIVALTGFVFIQIKARVVWRLSSLAFVLVASCRLCSFYTHLKIVSEYGETYSRGCKDFVYAIDQLSMESRTNDVHQACQRFSEVFYVTTQKEAQTNFAQLVADTCNLAFEQPNQVQNGITATNAVQKPSNTKLQAATHDIWPKLVLYAVLAFFGGLVVTGFAFYGAYQVFGVKGVIGVGIVVLFLFVAVGSFLILCEAL